MVLLALICITGFVIAKNWLDYDPKARKKIKNGRLVAVQSFDCNGIKVRKGTKGAKIETSVFFDLEDCSWADDRSELTGYCKVKGDSLIQNSKLHNWNVYNAEVINCECTESSANLAGIYGNDKFENEKKLSSNWF